jgi:DNA polymerase III subunit chi
MAEIGFYHLDRMPLEEALPKLLEKAYASGARILVRAPDDAAVERLNRLLWTYDAASFLPHGSAADGSPDAQLIYLTTLDENPNGADILVQVEGAQASDAGSYRRVLDLFDGGDQDALAAARERWRTCKAAGHELAYWQQKPGGGWERKA